MKHLIAICTAYFFLCGCSTSKHTAINSNEKLVGLWTETWLGADSKVDYVDTIQIKLDDNNRILMNCINNHHYTYDSIFFNKNELDYRFDNTVDPSVDFYVYYRLKLSKDEKTLLGPIVNIKLETDTVRLDKIR